MPFVLFGFFRPHPSTYGLSIQGMWSEEDRQLTQISDITMLKDISVLCRYGDETLVTCHKMRCCSLNVFLFTEKAPMHS